MTLDLLFDGVLVATLVFVAYRAIHAPALFTAVVVYIVFGAIMSLVWVRLHAPDLAIVEAAIGAGITGAILLGAARELADEGPAVAGGIGLRRWAAAASLGLAILLGTTLPRLAGPVTDLPRRVFERLPESGVEHPITAVLLNFRGYDTLLEVGVLLVASLGVMGLPGDPPRTVVEVRPPAVASNSAALLTAVGVLIAGYLLWAGSHRPGGAFQAGAVLASVAVLLSLVDRSPLTTLSGRSRAMAMIAGFAVFLAVGLTGMVRGGAFLEYGAAAGLAILVIESAVTVSVAFTLLLLFAGGPTAPGPHAG